MNKFWNYLLGREKQPARPSVESGPIALAAPEDQTLAVELNQVTKTYGNFSALQNVSLRVQKGECVGIVGFNGAGKSTLLQIVAGTLQPTSGTVKVNGRLVALLELGSGFNDDFTGLENIHMNAVMLGVSRDVIDARLPEIEAFAEIGDFIHKPVRTYSSGMRVRLAFSLLTQVDPDVMIIDEALAVGDAYFSHKCARVIRRFREEGRTLLFVSHDPSAVKTLCDRAVLLERGVLSRSGTPIEILDYYNALIAAQERDMDIRQQELTTGRRVTRSGNRKAILERFELIDEAGLPLRAVLSGKAVRICAVVSFVETVESPTVGFLLRDRLGNDIFGTNTFHLHTSLGSGEAGTKIEVCFKTVLQLGAGNYSLTMAVHGGAAHTEENYDWFDHMLAFTVVSHGPFYFVGVASLPVQAEVSSTIRYLSRRCAWNQTIAFAQGGNAELYKLDGWSFPETAFCWTNGTTASLAFDLPAPGRDAELVLDASPYLSADCKVQRVDVRVQGEILAHMEVNSPREYRCRLPARIFTGEFQLDLLLPDAVSPVNAGVGADLRQLGLAIRSLTWRVTG